MKNVTIMYSMPRSMTQWWRWLFSHGCHAVHDPLARARHPNHMLDVVKAAGGERIFIADTSAIYFHDYFQRLLPGHRRLYMLRNPADVCASLRQQVGYSMDGFIGDQYGRLCRHAWGEDNNVRLHYGCIKPSHLDALLPLVTGQDITVPGALCNIVDTPIRAQYRDPAATRSLFRYKDTQ